MSLDLRRENFRARFAKFVTESHRRRLDQSLLPIELLPEPSSKPNVVTEMQPYDKWPWFAREIAKHAEVGDSGVGDTAARLIDRYSVVGQDKVKSLIRTLKLGRPCRCDARHRRWNARYPYDGREGRSQL